MSDIRIFDAHFHIIEPGYPLIENQGYLPDFFTVADYREAMSAYQLVGGAVVSGSFQGFDQSWLSNALDILGPGFVGVTQLPVTVTDEEIFNLNQQGVRGLRFNLQRGSSEDVRYLSDFANRVYDIAGWHVELYLDSVMLPDLYDTIVKLPKVCIDHLGLRKAGLDHLLKLVEHGISVKACGFGRVDFDVATTLTAIHDINPAALMFGTDLPGTRAPRPFCQEDYFLILETLGEDATNRVLYENAVQFYCYSPSI